MLVRTDALLTGQWSHRNLPERDARLLTEKIVEQLFKLGMPASEFGVHLNEDGFHFAAEINGRRVWVNTPQSGFSYTSVAAGLIAAVQASVAADLPRDQMTTI